MDRNKHGKGIVDMSADLHRKIMIIEADPGIAMFLKTTIHAAG